MLYSFVLQLDIDKDLFLPPFSGHFFYSAFLKIIKKYDKSLFDKMHKQNVVKLFTISPLMGNFEYINKSILLKKKNNYFLRITILDKYDFAKILNLFLNKKIKQLKINDRKFNIIKICTIPQQHKYAFFVSVSDLWEKSSNNNSLVIFKFLSPTTFKAGKKNIFLPFAKLVFNSIKRKFDLIYNDKYKKFDILDKDIRIIRYENLSTKVIEIKGAKHICFAGECWYEIMADNKIKFINALANFATYSGVGAKTSMGLGQVIRTKV